MNHSFLYSKTLRLDRVQAVQLGALLESSCCQSSSYLSLIENELAQNSSQLDLLLHLGLQDQQLLPWLGSLQPRQLSYVPPTSMSCDSVLNELQNDYYLHPLFSNLPPSLFEPANGLLNKNSSYSLNSWSA